MSLSKLKEIMEKVSIPLLSLILFFAIGLFVWEAFLNKGSLVIESDPKLAKVSIPSLGINGETPFRKDDLKPGKYEVQVRKEGYLEATQTIEVKSGQENKSSVRLVPVPEFTKLTGKNSADLLWLDNDSLAFIYFDPDQKRNFLELVGNDLAAKIYDPKDVQFSENFWAPDGKLLVLDHGEKSSVWLISDFNSPEKLDFQGHGFSWMPNSEEFVFLQPVKGGEILKSYNIKEKEVKETEMSSVLPVQGSKISPNGKRALLYGETIDGFGKFYQLNLESGKVEELRWLVQLISLPLWSPDSNLIAYADTEGVKVGSSESGVKEVFPLSNNSAELSYVWLDNKSLIISELNRVSGKSRSLTFWKVDVISGAKVKLLSQSTGPIVSKPFLALSKDASKLAVGLGKEGIWILSLK